MKKGFKIFIASVLCFSSIAVSAFAKPNDDFQEKIFKVYSSWQECKAVGEKVTQDSFTYQLIEIKKIEDNGKFLATYYLPITVTRTYMSWNECKAFGTEFEQDGMTYSLIKAKRIGKTDRFLATYEIEK